MLQLKEYQQKALDALTAYFQATVQMGSADDAYYRITRQMHGQGIAYRRAPGLLDMPYVCVRIPTGGGKTLVACHAVGLAARELLRTDKPLTLWLVPSNAILEQTLNALKERTHPYRRAVEQAVGGSLTVLTVAEALRVNRPTLESGATVIVSTIQAFRVEETEGRKVYDVSGYLMDHFENLPAPLVQQLERWEDGKPIPSLCNVLRLRRPLVIVDEAHNARTELSFETLSRFEPSCILEFSATPDTERQPSNVLYSVSAAELKAEEMIKMPILLETRPHWRELLADAIARLNGLQQAAATAQLTSGEYLRPVMLIQAENRSSVRETVTVETVKKVLLEDFAIPPEQIALSAYEYDDLAGVDIADPTCPIRFVITVSKLKEGWDCPFAYVLCSVAEVHSATAAEQILGRVMRLPNARRKSDEQLNRAYAFVASADFAAVLASLKEGLVQNGFQRFEVEGMVQARQPLQEDFGPLFQDPSAPNFALPPLDAEQLASLPSAVAARVQTQDDGSLVFVGPMDATSRDVFQSMYTNPADRAALGRVYAVSNVLPTQPVSPAERGESFAVPVLAYRQGSLLERFEANHFLDRPWQLFHRDKQLSEADFPHKQASAELAEIDIAKDQQITYRFVEHIHNQMRLLARDQRWAESDLILWLDRGIPHRDITAKDSLAFITGVVRFLLGERGESLDRLIHDKYRLRQAVAAKIEAHRSAVSEEAFAQLLFESSPLEVTPELLFTYDPNAYPINRAYPRPQEFPKHYYPAVGDFDSQEEHDCALHIESLPEVERWVRNPVRSSKAFWLQTSTDKFYPDFVCRLRDGRFLTIEYKGAVYSTNDDSREKNTIGEVWEKRSNGRCLFLMVSNRNYQAIRAKLAV